MFYDISNIISEAYEFAYSNVEAGNSIIERTITTLCCGEVA
jgi:hypothetical protein